MPVGIGHRRGTARRALRSFVQARKPSPMARGLIGWLGSGVGHTGGAIARWRKQFGCHGFDGVVPGIRYRVPSVVGSPTRVLLRSVINRNGARVQIRSGVIRVLWRWFVARPAISVSTPMSWFPDFGWVRGIQQPSLVLFSVTKVIWVGLRAGGISMEYSET